LFGVFTRPPRSGLDVGELTTLLRGSGG
jgi:hypothetical protein